MNSLKGLPSSLKLIFAVLFLVSISSIATNIILLRGAKKVETSNFSAETEVGEVVFEVNKVIILPEGETPTLATVTDLSLLKDQPFFTKAAVGDLVLIYTTSKKVILWRPSTKQVVEVSSLNVTTPDSNGNPQ